MPRVADFTIASFIVAFTLSLGFASIAAAQNGQPMLLPVDPASLVAHTDSGEKTFSIEIADNNDERSRGLMFRNSLPSDRGMLFVFEETRRVAFWMKNTPLPLDLIFIGADGRVKSVRHGVPFSETPIPADGPVRFVLELKKGTADITGITAGDRLRHPQIDAIAGAD